MPVKNIASGIECEIKGNYKTFGKFMINMDLLINDGILLIKYLRSYAPTAIKRKKVGVEFKNTMLDLFDTSKINYELLKECSHKDRKLFEDLITRAGLHKQLQYDANLCKMNETGLKLRFQILQGQVISGNNNQEIFEELEFVIKELMILNVINEANGKELLEELIG